MILGITGQIGSGKSTAAAILRQMGAAVIDADRIGKLVVNRDLQLRQKLVRQFGPDIIDAAGRLRRRYLARLAFANERSNRALNRLVHPALLKELKSRVRDQARRYNLVVIDAALLLDWNLDRFADHVLVLHASQEVRFDRLRRRGIDRADARARQKAQLPYAEYRRRSDTIILNSGTIADLKRKLTKFIGTLDIE